MTTEINRLTQWSSRPLGRFRPSFWLLVILFVKEIRYVYCRWTWHQVLTVRRGHISLQPTPRPTSAARTLPSVESRPNLRLWRPIRLFWIDCGSTTATSCLPREPPGRSSFERVPAMVVYVASCVVLWVSCALAGASVTTVLAPNRWQWLLRPAISHQFQQAPEWHRDPDPSRLAVLRRSDVSREPISFSSVHLNRLAAASCSRCTSSAMSDSRARKLT